METKGAKYTVEAEDNEIINSLAKKLGIKPDQVIIQGIRVMQLYQRLKEDGHKKLIIKDDKNNEQELTLL